MQQAKCSLASGLGHSGGRAWKEAMDYVPQSSVLGPILFSLFINDLSLHVKDTSVDCDMLGDDTTLHTSGKDIMQIRSNMQDSKIRYPVGVIIIIWSSIRSRPSL